MRGQVQVATVRSLLQEAVCALHDIKKKGSSKYRHRRNSRSHCRPRHTTRKKSGAVEEGRVVRQDFNRTNHFSHRIRRRLRRVHHQTGSFVLSRFFSRYLKVPYGTRTPYIQIKWPITGLFRKSHRKMHQVRKERSSTKDEKHVRPRGPNLHL